LPWWCSWHVGGPVSSFVDGVEEPPAESSQLRGGDLGLLVQTSVLFTQTPYLAFQHLTLSVLLPHTHDSSMITTTTTTTTTAEVCSLCPRLHIADSIPHSPTSHALCSPAAHTPQLNDNYYYYYYYYSRGAQPVPQVGPGFKLQPLRCRVSLRQTVHTHRPSFHQAANLVAALLRVARVTAGLAESNGSLLPGL